MRNVRSRSCENLSVVISVVRHSSCEGYWNARMTLQGLLGMSVETEEDVDRLVKDTERQQLLDEIADEVGLKHPITFDVYDLCEYYHQNKLSAFNVQMLKNILSHLEVPLKSKGKKSILISKFREVIAACKRDATPYD